VARIPAEQLGAVERWHDAAPGAFGVDLVQVALAQHYINFLQWHAEDASREPAATDAEVAAAKREIDALNRRRHELIEAVDERIAALLDAAGRPQNSAAPLNSESPGSVVDRCSILALRLWHGRAGSRCLSATSAANPDDVRAIAAQREDLATCLCDLVADVAAGRRRYRAYRHYKSYRGASSAPAKVRR
jgi:hypothetical protein